ncbi:MAG: Mov34/MPN/PAD-1 family protein [Deltaproteobacteria bacterium]|nr:Mov34/MPN/PAD-1 family protein [Deltaproteobacteria bacterium]
MMTWKGKTEGGRFAVELPDTVINALDRYCREAGSSETGGILIGRHSADLSVATVYEATPPPSDSRRGRSWFLRGVNGLREMLHKRWRAVERTHYLGEWHFHPVAHIEPSSDDFEQMIEINNSKDYDCKEPIMLILGTGERQRQRPFRAFVCPDDGPPLELIAIPN